jgi:hypothetical protein
MDEHRRDRGDHEHGGGEHRGPPETGWLDLELSKVIEGQAERIAREGVEELLKFHIKARLLERLGPRLEAIGRLVADQLVDDMEANLDIEARIAARRQARGNLDGRIAEALGALRTPGHDGGRAPKPPGEKRGGEGEPR